METVEMHSALLLLLYNDQATDIRTDAQFCLSFRSLLLTTLTHLPSPNHLQVCDNRLLLSKQQHDLLPRHGQQ